MAHPGNFSRLFSHFYEDLHLTTTSRIVAGLSATLVVAVVSFALTNKGNDNRIHNKDLIPIRIAFPVTVSSALPVIANDDSHWRKAGLNVKAITPGTGAECIALLEKGETDFAVAYDTPVVNSIIRGTGIRVLSELHEARVNTALVYRRDRNIKAPGDIAGKRVGIIAGTNADFFIDLFMKSNVLGRDQVDIVANTFESQIDDISSGRLDAVVTWEPRVSVLVNENPELIGIFTLPFYSEVSMIVTTGTYADKNPGILQQVIDGLVGAKARLDANPDHGHQIVRNFMSNRDQKVNEGAWSKMQFRLGLGHFLQTTLREQLRQKLAASHTVPQAGLDELNPDIVPYIEPRPLQSVMPRWVSLP